MPSESPLADPVPAAAALEVRDLGRLPYVPALEVQQHTHQAVLDRRSPPVLLLVEHDPVITVSRRKTAGDNLLADRATLQRLAIDVQPTDRGGDVTYHGPGQIVAYPILRLTDYGLNVGGYMRLLEQIAIDTLAAFGIAGRRDPPHTGVWVDRGAAGAATPGPAKICALGVRVRRNVTMHGLALNVDPDLRHFATIVPCGLVGRGVTSMREWLGDATPPLDRVKAELAAAFRRRCRAVTRS